MPKVTHVPTGVIVSVSDATAESLTGSVWRLADEAAKPATKTSTKRTTAKAKAKAPAAPKE